MDADEAAGQREGVDRGIVDDEEREFVRTIAVRLRRQPVADFVDVLGDLRIFDDLTAEPNIAHDRAPDLRFCRLGQNRVGGAAHIGYLYVIGTRATRKYECRDGNEQQGTFEKGVDQQQLLDWLRH